MEKSAETIGRHKFCKLKSRRCHKVLAALAEHALTWQPMNLAKFQERYQELHSWRALDCFKGPQWLSPEEYLRACRDFHLQRAGKAHQVPESGQTAPLATKAWQPCLDVEVVVDQVRSPFNLGAMLRLIDNFGLTRLVHGDPHFPLEHPRLAKAAMGAQAWIPIHYCPCLPEYIVRKGTHAVALETGPNALPIQEWKPSLPTTLVVGHEEQGISQKILAAIPTRVAIPMAGNKHSMNVSHALAVALYHIQTTLQASTDQ